MSSNSCSVLNSSSRNSASPRIITMFVQCFYMSSAGEIQMVCLRWKLLLLNSKPFFFFSSYSSICWFNHREDFPFQFSQQQYLGTDVTFPEKAIVGSSFWISYWYLVNACKTSAVCQSADLPYWRSKHENLWLFYLLIR